MFPLEYHHHQFKIGFHYPVQSQRISFHYHVGRPIILRPSGWKFSNLGAVLKSPSLRCHYATCFCSLVFFFLNHIPRIHTALRTMLRKWSLNSFHNAFLPFQFSCFQMSSEPSLQFNM